MSDLPTPDYAALDDVLDLEPPPPPAPRVIVLRWDSIVTATASLLVGVVLGIMLNTLVVELAQPRVPACTHAIADAGGICIGEPR